MRRFRRAHRTVLEVHAATGEPCGPVDIGGKRRSFIRAAKFHHAHAGINERRASGGSRLGRNHVERIALDILGVEPLAEPGALVERRGQKVSPAESVTAPTGCEPEKETVQTRIRLPAWNCIPERPKRSDFGAGDLLGYLMDNELNAPCPGRATEARTSASVVKGRMPVKHFRKCRLLSSA